MDFRFWILDCKTYAWAYQIIAGQGFKACVISKLGIVEEEADESIYWMELLVESGLVSQTKMTNLMNEMHEIVAMIVASIKTLRANQQSIQNPKSKI